MTKTAREVIADVLFDIEENMDSLEQNADAILTALRDAGFAVVPVEPTAHMMVEGNIAMGKPLRTASRVWDEMLKASQEQSE